ncbi:branched-chain amino acid ABC transporter permease [Micromonospora sp. NPDC023814]|uniref:branched-chain amino acid ABC transporter permease n=1 Tax=Micromonospora sp. NPDC023814 TaxID=3154596 RepID=UPI0033E0826F
MSSPTSEARYRRELSLRPGTSAKVGTLAVTALLLVLPLLVGPRWQTIGVYAFIAAIAALGMHVLSGLAGQISLGHAAFLAIGAYTACWLGVDQELPIWVWLPASGLVAGLAGAVLGPVAARIRGLYLAVATLALVFILQYVWQVWGELTGGVNGRPAPAVLFDGEDLLRGVEIGGLHLTGEQAWWYFALAALGVALLASLNIQRSRMGRAFMAVRDRDLAAGVAGVPVRRTKVTAFVVSATFTGIAGALLASFQSYIVPTQWGLMLSIEYIAMVVIGGLGTTFGAVAGAFFVTSMPQVVHALAGFLPFIAETSSTDGGISVPLLSEFLYGFAIVLVLLFEPDGLHALWVRAKRFVVRPPAAPPPTPEPAIAELSGAGHVA